MKKAKALRRVRVSALRGKGVTRAILRRGTVRKVGTNVVLTLHLGSGALDATGLVVPNGAIANGAAVI